MLLFIIWKKLAARKNAPHLSKLPNCISTFILFQSSISQKLQIKMILFYIVVYNLVFLLVVSRSDIVFCIKEYWTVSTLDTKTTLVIYFFLTN